MTPRNCTQSIQGAKKTVRRPNPNPTPPTPPATPGGGEGEQPTEEREAQSRNEDGIEFECAPASVIVEGVQHYIS